MLSFCRYGLNNKLFTKAMAPYICGLKTCYEKRLLERDR